jgi:glutamyl-tRNA reductase
VAAGLDSLVLGESEIARQVSDALQSARAVGAVDIVLSEVFRAAIRAGRRARAETGISRRPASVSSVAVGLADEASGTLAGKRVLLVGTGKVGKQACEALRGKGAAPVRVLSRNPDHAAGLAAQFQAASGSLADLETALVDADVVISSTGAPGVILDRGAVERAMAQRPQRSLTLIDIAVPRDVDAAVGELAGVALFDIDDLQGRIDDHVAARSGEVSSVERIIDEELMSFGARHEQLGVRPLIADLRSRAEDIRRREVARTLQRLGDVDEATRAQVEHLSRALVNKLLHEPTIRLRADAARYQSDDVAELARELFGLEEDRASLAP